MRIRKQREAKVAKTRAWVALCEALENETQLDLRKKCGVPQSVISSLVTRTRMPGRETMFKLEKLGIKAAWWDERPSKKAA